MIIRSNFSITCSNIIIALIVLSQIIGKHVTQAAPNASEITSNERTRYKRMYALCPPKFQRIGNECYFVSHYKKNWLDAHFECKDRHSKLAEPLKYEDKRIRKYLLQFDLDHSDKWMGAIFNWEKDRWQWGYSGRNLQYQAFSRMNPGAREQLKYHCAVFSAKLKYRWSPRSCTDQHYFVCQHRMPLVSSKNRYRVYQKWNQTFPNELANENEVIVSNKNRNGQYKYRIANAKTDRDLNRIHFVKNDKQRRTRPIQNNDINPANYGDNRPAERRSRDPSHGWHPIANLPVHTKSSKNVLHPIKLNPVSGATSHMSSSFREVDPASIFHHPDTSRAGNIGQKVGPIRQKIETGPDGKTKLIMNIGQKRFGLDRPVEKETQAPRTRRRRPSTTIRPEQTTTTTTEKPILLPKLTFETEPSIVEKHTKAKTTTTTTTTTTTVLPQTSSTTIPSTSSPKQWQLSEKDLKRQQLMERLAKLTPEERLEFFEKRRKAKQQRQAKLLNDV
uniref:CSON009576 protein n=1 Tax=Culicoides sonorensis TaxID=179676 RepID=A0A336M159_CULSO